MKTHIVQLERHDNLVSTRDKMSWSMADRILVVWPDDMILARRYDLCVLRRYANAAGAQLALIAPYALIRMHAAQLGIPMFSCVDQAQESHWKPAPVVQPTSPPGHARPALPIDMPRRVHNQHSRAVTGFVKRFLAAITMGAAVAGCFLVIPSAEINLGQGALTQEIQLDLIAVYPERGEIHSELIEYAVRSVIFTQTEVIDVSGQIEIPGAAANGEICFTNLTDREQVIPEGTVVRPDDNPGARYATIDAAVLDAVPGKQLMVGIEALQPGGALNLPAEQIDALEGALGLNVSVTNPKAIGGGTDLWVSAPTDEDRVDLKADLLADMADQARQALNEGLLPGDRAVSATLTLSQMISEQYDPLPGEPGERLSLTIEALYEILVIPNREIMRVTQTALDNDLPEGYQPSGAEITISDVTTPQVDQGGRMKWTVTAARSVEVLDPHILLPALAGLTLTRASDHLQTALDLDQLPQISTSPRWWPIMPLLTSRILFTMDGG